MNILILLLKIKVNDSDVVKIDKIIQFFNAIEIEIYLM